MSYFLQLKKLLVFLLLFGTTIDTSPLTAAPKVVVSIAPLHSLVAGIMKNIAHPTLLLQQTQSPHTYSLRPSEAKLLNSADIIIWIGPELETFMQKAMVSSSQIENQLRVLDLKGLTIYPVRDGSEWQHTHDHAHEKGLRDAHIWLDIHNAKIIVQAIADFLANKDPQNAAVYRSNQQKILIELDQLAQKLKKTLSPVKNRAFLVFHDGYQYWERYFNLKGVGSITFNPELPISVKRLKEVNTLVQTAKVRCLFSEAQFQTNLVPRLAEKLSIKVGILDPYGVSLNEPAEKRYFTLMQNLANQFSECLR